MQLDLQGRRALVLSSSRGLGLGVAEALAAEGASVMLVGRNRERLAEAAAAINTRSSGHAEFVCADLGDAGFVDKVRVAAVDAFKGIDILVNNTGGPPPGAAADIAPALLVTQFEAMVSRVIAMTTAVLPGMRAQKWGRVLTIGSSGVIQPIPNLALSNTLRSALVGWSKTLAGEVAGEGVCVNMLVPGRIGTDRVDELDETAAKRQGKSIEDVRAQSRASIPAGRYGDVAEFASVAAFLCSARASYVTGSVIRCDGGMIRNV